MTKRNTRAGGFFWMIAILAGFVWGVAGGEPMKGILAGAGVGAFAALLLWLVDRRR